MAGARKARLPTVAKLLGADYKTLGESRSEEEQKRRKNKLQHYVSKKKVILLPGTVLEQEEKNKFGKENKDEKKTNE